MQKSKPENKGFALAPNYTNSVAASLRTVEAEIERLTKRRDEYREELMNLMKKQGVKAIELDSGDKYLRVPKTSLLITDKGKAKRWALENPDARMILSRGAALKVAKQGKTPFLKVVHDEHLRILRRGQKDVTEVDGEEDNT